MKILFCTQYFLPTRGGQQYSTYFLIKELLKQNVSVTLLTFKKGNIADIDEDLKDFKILRMQSNIEVKRSNFSTNYFTILPKLVATHDLVHINIPSPIFVELLTIYSKLYNKPIFVSERGEPYHKRGLFGSIYKLYIKLLFSNFIKLGTVFHTTTSSYRKSLSFVSSLKRISTTIIPHGVNPEFHKKIIADDTKLMSVDTLTETKYFLFVGSLHKDNYYKGVHILLRAFRSFKGSNNNEIGLIIIGEGELKPKLQKYADRLQISNSVTFLGGIDQNSLKIMYKNAIALILPSIHGPESFGIVMIEAMSQETPVIASNLPGLNEVVVPNYNGFLVEPNDDQDLAEKMQILVNHGSNRKELGINGKLDVMQKYSWRKIAENYVKVYSAFIKKK